MMTFAGHDAGLRGTAIEKLDDGCVMRGETQCRTSLQCTSLSPRGVYSVECLLELVE